MYEVAGAEIAFEAEGEQEYFPPSDGLTAAASPVNGGG